ncbi:complement C1q subcomponent subunit B-like protein [Labeo rohita]|uniref:Complement C1q subcomponent subunit B-like protein n=1 Tax=Labeo rohita TaxID=84645 RepID=A0A498MYW8_LABRO|nr:complement C1q subcomponent subunit B-like protein [Labeo rohita]
MGVFWVKQDLLQELGATKEKLQATETRLKALETSQQELMSKHANSEAQIDKIKMEKQGIFTAPVRGLYYFSFFYHCATTCDTWLHLCRNGMKEGIAGQHKTEHGTQANGQNGITLLLEKGDQVYIVLLKNSWIWDGQMDTLFSGFLIDAM